MKEIKKKHRDKDVYLVTFFQHGCTTDGLDVKGDATYLI